MKTTTAFKIQLIKQAHTRGHKPEVIIRDGGTHKVESVKSYQHSIVLKVERGGGFLVIDPDDIVAVKLHTFPNANDD